MLPLCAVPLLVSSVGKTDIRRLPLRQRGLPAHAREQRYKRCPMVGRDVVVLVACAALVVAGALCGGAQGGGRRYCSYNNPLGRFHLARGGFCTNERNCREALELLV